MFPKLDEFNFPQVGDVYFLVSLVVRCDSLQLIAGSFFAVKK
jgi:hypothetical protein